jgi:hypothetical protein
MAALRIGLISDTHGLLRPEALSFLAGCDQIVHAGDIGSAAILDTLAGIAPLTAVRGNNDTAGWAAGLPDTALLQAGGILLYALHDLAQLAIDPASRGLRVVVSGHSHKPKIEARHGVLFVNPGSAGPRRFSLPVSAAELLVDEEGAVSARTVELAAPTRR